MPEAMVKFACDTAREAGKILLGHFGRIRSGAPKNQRGDMVTQADLESESFIIRRISGEYPDHRILAEESGMLDIAEGECTWIIDPLDGTKNFTLCIPFFCVSIGILCGDRITAGAVYDPIHDDMFYAVEGAGAYLNGAPIRVSDQTDPGLMVVNLAWSKNSSDGRDFAEYAVGIVERTNYFRRLGSAALVMSYVAVGRLDASVSLDLKPWDAAAATLIIREAGGVVTDFEGSPLDVTNPSLDIVCANPVLHEKMLKEIFAT